MPLRTRIILLVSLAFALAFAGLVAAGMQRERLAAVPYTDIGTLGQTALWREILEDDTQRLVTLSDEILADDGLREAVAARSLPQMRSLATSWTIPRFASGTLTDLQILDDSGQVLFASSTAAEPPRLLDFSTIRNVHAGAAPRGIRQITADRFLVIMARQYPTPGGDFVLALAASAQPALRRFARSMEADAFLLSTRGRLVEGTKPELWRALSLDLPQRVATVRQAALDGRLYSVTAIPLQDLSSGSAGLLVTVKDATESLSALHRLTMITGAGVLGLLALLLGGLYLYLRESFRPLDRAVGVLGALSRGDTSVDLPKESNDEIGEIATAVQGLRANLVAFNDSRRQRELQRRRQERFVRRQMENLASTLEPGAREEVLTDLRRIVAATSGAAPEAEGAEPAPQSLARLIREDDQLGPLAAVLQQMSGRVVDQHRRLSELVTRLREALVRETQLASLQQELAIARDLQRSVLPVDFPDRPRFSAFGLMESAREVGGDFYDFFEQRDGRFAFLIADVSGKGVPAAFFMAIARTLLKAIALFESDPASCVRQLNELLAAGNDQMMFVTLFFCVLDPATGEVEYVNAGHNPPYLVGRSGEVTMLATSDDLAVAVMSGVDFSSRRIRLAPGDTLVLYTDGVTEAFNNEDQPFGDARLKATLEAAPRRDPQNLARAVAQAVRTFESGHQQSDDLTLLAMSYKG
ncbi:SpoIIE family protein phosphatase [Rhodoligotrophos defluvii]|uniref:SpoIIE family protein phosphatase n=1 Tax=Rhodoligotrophos defluvii TaxID=2561934 RepID=UPI0010CA1EC9|nr:SpoIIE family protein phosphatase [Rhodoligotrophos defluvii]